MKWIIVANVIGWPVIHVLVSWLFIKLPITVFNTDSFGFRERPWEHGGTLYTKWLAVKRWKGRLPDAAAWFSNGFAKKKIQSRNLQYLDRFARETCRGEAAHWATMLLCPIFFLWNPPWACAVMVVYAVLSNLPCIIVQRYNRIVLRKLRDTHPRLRAAK